MKNFFSPRLKSWAVLFPFILCFSIQAQTKTNIEIFKALVDSSIVDILENNPNVSDDIALKVNLSPSYQIFENQIYKSVKSLSKNIVSSNGEIKNSLFIYAIENAKVSYGEVFRNSLLGDHFIERKAALNGSYTIHGDAITTDNFYLENVDTVLYDEITSLENPAYPFTQGELPSEPFLSNIFEPIVALTAAAIVITLFFTVRSK